MHGVHQCAPTYSPKTEWPGLVANLGISLTASCSLSVVCSSIKKNPIADMVSIKIAIVIEESSFTRCAVVIVLSGVWPRIILIYLCLTLEHDPLGSEIE